MTAPARTFETLPPDLVELLRANPRQWLEVRDVADRDAAAMKVVDAVVPVVEPDGMAL